MLTASPTAADPSPLPARQDPGSLPAPVPAPKQHRSAVLLLVFLCRLAGSLTAPPPARADDVVVGFVAIVDGIDDQFCQCIPPGAITPGDTLVGFYTYGTDLPDSNPASNVGRYDERRAPHRMVVYHKSYTFASNPNDPLIIATVTDSVGPQFGSPNGDQFQVWSWNNGIDPFRSPVKLPALGFLLYEPSGLALDNDSLLVSPPDTTVWPVRDLQVYGDSYDWAIYATVVSIGWGPPVAIRDTPAPKATLTTWPNPFNPATTLGFVVESAGSVRLDIYDIRGRRVATLVNRIVQPGSHEARWNGRDDRGVPAASGVYFATLRAGAGRVTRKLVLIR